MLYQVKIRVLSHFLGDRPDQGVLRFNRADTSADHWTIPPNEWRWVLREAIRSLHMESITSCDFIFPPMGIAMPSIHLYTREKGKARPHKPGIGKPQPHEAFRPGDTMIIPLQVVSSLPPLSGGAVSASYDTDEEPCVGESSSGLQPPTREQIEKIMRHIGSFIGLSPWGKMHLKGRFEVISVADENA